MIDLCVTICSRGTVHSHTMEGRDKNLVEAGLSWQPVWSHDKSIPDAQNYVVEQALFFSPEWIWMLEEDVEAPSGTLIDMLSLGKKFPVVAASYKMPGGTWCHHAQDNKLVWAGTGCLLVHADVFRQLEKPWFRTDRFYNWNRLDGFQRAHAEVNTYGHQDIHFFATLEKAHISSALASSICKHWRVHKWGEARSNKGCHELEEIV